MSTVITPSRGTAQRQTSYMLHELGVPVHRVGYPQLCVGIPRFAENKTQSLTKDLYPYIADHFGHFDWRSTEHAMRLAILHAWDHGDPAAWAKYFPGLQKAPSNKLFISTLAEYL